MRIITLLMVCIQASFIFAQQNLPEIQLWHLEPYSKKGHSGIGLEEAMEMVKDKTPTTIVVAIADAGVDVNHPDLKNMLWTNPSEIAGNGIDDDKNGYIDDVYGWNFIGETIYDNLEITRQYVILNEKYELKPESEITDKEEYARYQEIKTTFLAKNLEYKMNFEFFSDLIKGMESLEESYGTDMTKEELANHKSNSKSEIVAKNLLDRLVKVTDEFDYLGIKDQMTQAYNQFDRAYSYNYNPEFDPRAEKVGDDYSNPNERYYGNNNVYYGEHSSHGTHVAGIVAADGSNNVGAKGICQSCEIMSIRNVPEGDERDKDVANSIRYAVDNGAKIVNMSFGKSHSHNSAIVYEAIKYAESKNVLLVHAAGNSSLNLETAKNFPNDNNNATNNWLEVGASSWEKKPKALATFSNYGSSQVDLFAPGVKVYSTTPEGEYEAYNGTSMASPVAAGVAAFVWSYYPTLTAAELKTILIESAIPIKGRNKVPGSKKKKRVCKVSKSGAEINLPAALRMAEAMTSKN